MGAKQFNTRSPPPQSRATYYLLTNVYYEMCRGLSDRGSSDDPRPTLMAGSLPPSAGVSVASSRLARRAATIHCRFSCSSHARRSLSVLNGGPCAGEPSRLRPVPPSLRSASAICSLASDDAVGAWVGLGVREVLPVKLRARSHKSP